MQGIIQVQERNWDRRGNVPGAEAGANNYHNWENTGGERRTGAISKKLVW